MRKWFGQSLRLGLAPDGLALVRTSIWPHERARLLAQARFKENNVEAALREAERMLADHEREGWALRVVLSDELVRLWQVAPPPGAARMADLEAACALRYRALFGASPAGWQVRADWSATRPFLASAVPQALLAQLQQAAAGSGFRLVEVAPQFVAALNQHRSMRRPGAWFGVVHGGVLSVAAFDGALLAAVRTAPIPEGADRDWLEGHVAREALRVGLGRPERLQVCGPAPKAWASSAGRLKFACTLFEDELDPLWPDSARLAMTGRAP
ncbi:hypothetical protein [Massilia aerilata]|uniref:DUF3025 domain-containing protein n=1 Tax=Massilia aerilata TaxID=453817 RepID=A0ABW0S144_9BURK